MNKLEKNVALSLILVGLYFVIICIAKTLINDIVFTNILAFILIIMAVVYTLVLVGKVLK